MGLSVVKSNNTNIVQLKMINGTGRFTKDGKWIPNPQKETRWVSPIRDKADVNRCIEYLKSKTKTAHRCNEVFASKRNLMLFIVGINIGLRVSDLSTLKWSHFYEEDMETFVDARNKREKKTGKMKLIIPNKSIQKITEWYLNETEIHPNYDDYVFLQYKKNEHIGWDVIDSMMKDLQVNLHLEGSYSTHSLRKTNAYQKYIMLKEAGDPFALEKVQRGLNHRTPYQTLTYLGITRETVIYDQFALDDWWGNM